MHFPPINNGTMPFVDAANRFSALSGIDVVIGIDPGVSGAISVIDRVSGRLVACFDLPTLKIPKSPRKRRQQEDPEDDGEPLKSGPKKKARYRLAPEVDLVLTRYFLDAFSGPGKAAHVALENVWGRKSAPGRGGQSISSETALIGAANQIEGMLVGVGLSYRKVVPQVWKKWARIIGPDGDLARRRCGEMFPTAGAAWPLVKDHNRAESALIAAWGRAMLIAGL